MNAQKSSSNPQCSEKEGSQDQTLAKNRKAKSSKSRPGPRNLGLSSSSRMAWERDCLEVKNAAQQKQENKKNTADQNVLRSTLEGSHASTRSVKLNQEDPSPQAPEEAIADPLLPLRPTAQPTPCSQQPKANGRFSDHEPCPTQSPRRVEGRFNRKGRTQTLLL